jgi:hypothetical protein
MAAAQPFTSLDDPLADWPNDDLLLGAPARAFFAAHHPAVLPVFDWPELRALFARLDGRAGQYRRHSRFFGVAAALLGGLSLVVAALTPLVAALSSTTWPLRLLGAAAAALVLASGATGYVHLLWSRSRAGWLEQRFLTERLRQLHFQFILCNLPAAVAAMRDAQGLAQWTALRARALAVFERDVRAPIVASLASLVADEAQEDIWLDPAWREDSPCPAPGAEFDAILETMARQRFGIQRRYCQLKLEPGFHSCATRLRVIRTVSDVLTLALLVLAGATGVATLLVDPRDSLLLAALASVTGLASAVIVTLRVIGEGLQLASETGRYIWYEAAARGLERRFAQGGPAARIARLRDMERLAYEELRWFIVDFREARFVM